VLIWVILTMNRTGNGTLDVIVPVNSFDFNAIAAPEPASLGMLGSGSTLLGWQLLRDRKRRVLLRRSG